MRAQAKKRMMRVGAAGAVASLALAVPSLAFAAERQTAGINAILPQMDEFIPMLVAFIILLIILGKFGWPAFDAVLKKREETIRDSIERSEEARIESERVLEQNRAELADAKQLAADIVAQARKSGEAVRDEITQKAQADAEAMMEKARLTIEQERELTAAELQRSVADLSVSVAGRLIGSDLTDEEHRQLIERYVKEAGSLNA